MGWKIFKENFNIKHIVQITDKGLCIGSEYVHDLVVINQTTGELEENKTFSGFLRERYPNILNSSQDEIVKILNLKDSFSQSLKVYTSKNGEILEKECETYGYPNVTHDGLLMYENRFFQDKSKAIRSAVESYEYSINNLNDRIARLEDEIKACRLQINDKHEMLNKLLSLSNMETT